MGWIAHSSMSAQIHKKSQKHLFWYNKYIIIKKEQYALGIWTVEISNKWVYIMSLDNNSHSVFLFDSGYEIWQKDAGR